MALAELRQLEDSKGSVWVLDEDAKRELELLRFRLCYHPPRKLSFTGLALWVYATLVVLGGWVGSLAQMCTFLAVDCWRSLVLGFTSLPYDKWHVQFSNAGRLPVISTTMTYLMFLVFQLSVVT